MESFIIESFFISNEAFQSQLNDYKNSTNSNDLEQLSQMIRVIKISLEDKNLTPIIKYNALYFLKECLSLGNKIFIDLVVSDILPVLKELISIMEKLKNKGEIFNIVRNSELTLKSKDEKANKKLGENFYDLFIENIIVWNIWFPSYKSFHNLTLSNLKFPNTKNLKFFKQEELHPKIEEKINSEVNLNNNNNNNEGIKVDYEKNYNIFKNFKENIFLIMETNENNYDKEFFISCVENLKEFQSFMKKNVEKMFDIELDPDLSFNLFNAFEFSNVFLMNFDDLLNNKINYTAFRDIYIEKKKNNKNDVEITLDEKKNSKENDKYEEVKFEENKANFNKDENNYQITDKGNNNNKDNVTTKGNNEGFIKNSQNKDVIEFVEELLQFGDFEENSKQLLLPLINESDNNISYLIEFISYLLKNFEENYKKINSLLLFLIVFIENEKKFEKVNWKIFLKFIEDKLIINLSDNVKKFHRENMNLNIILEIIWFFSFENTFFFDIYENLLLEKVNFPCSQIYFKEITFNIEIEYNNVVNKFDTLKNNFLNFLKETNSFDEIIQLKNIFDNDFNSSKELLLRLENLKNFFENYFDKSNKIEMSLKFINNTNDNFFDLNLNKISPQQFKIEYFPVNEKIEENLLHNEKIEENLFINENNIG